MNRAAARSKLDWAKLAADLERLNRILIPKSKAEKDRFDQSRMAKVFRRAIEASERLSEEGQAVMVVGFLSGLAAIDVLHSEIYVAWSVMVALVVASLLVSPMLRLRRARLSVLAPRRVAVGEEACFTVVVQNDDDRALSSLKVRGAFLTWDGRWTRRSAGIPTVDAGGRASIELRARFSARGAHTLPPMSVRALVPLGFAMGPRAESDAVRVLVVPKVARIASLTLPQARRHHRGGVPRASHTADARELAGVRPYRIGDPVRDLHARTWARIGEPVVREYREEYFARVGVVLDTDLSRADPHAFEAAVSLVAGVVGRVIGREALVDVLVVGGTVHGATLGRSLGTLDVALDLLASAEPEGAFDGDLLWGRLQPHLSRLSAIVFVTTTWDDARRSLTKRLNATNTACAAYVVGTGADEPHVRHVDAAAIERGEAVTL